MIRLRNRGRIMNKQCKICGGEMIDFDKEMKEVGIEPCEDIFICFDCGATIKKEDNNDE
jgi:uncharacterized protein with PIN domain